MPDINDELLENSMPIVNRQEGERSTSPATLRAGENIADMLGVKLAPSPTGVVLRTDAAHKVVPKAAIKTYAELPGKGRGNKGWEGYPFDSLKLKGELDEHGNTVEGNQGFEIVGQKHMESCRNAAQRWAKVTGKGVVSRTIGKAGEGEFADYEPKGEIVFAVIRNR